MIPSPWKVSLLVITGGSRGIGAERRALARSGAGVILEGRNLAELGNC